MSELSRRDSLKVFGAISAAGSAVTASAQETPSGPSSSFVSDWDRMHDRVWLSGDVWANPMEDWRIVDGAAEVQSGGGYRNIQLITHLAKNQGGDLSMSVRVSQVEGGKAEDGVGFLIGSHSELDEPKSNSFAKNGLTVGLQGKQAIVGKKSVALPAGFVRDDVTLHVSATPAPSSGRAMYDVKLNVMNEEGETVASLENTVPWDRIRGNVALVNNFDPKTQARGGARHSFREWAVGGSVFEVKEDDAFGPILWSMYTLSNSRSDEGFVMKLIALFGPLGDDDNDQVQLQVRENGNWKTLATEAIESDSATAIFRVANWDESKPHDFRVLYAMKHTDGGSTEHEWTGTIRSNPEGRPLRFAPMTCQNDYGFPYAPVAENVAKLDPDLLYFSGDQLYEGHGGYGLIRDPADRAILNYLRKFYQFGWSFREPMRHAPTVCIPDDHDVFQGNIWGEGGAKMKEQDKGTSSKGGYREPVRMVNVVHRTNAGHHPEPFDPTPAKQNMSVYYGDMVYGNVSFAILGDRQFKSGPERVETGSGRADHVHDRSFDVSLLDKPGLELLGERQETFLKAWAEDWRGATMKVLLSQTVFAGVATHHGGYDSFLRADLDSGGWPQTARNRAIDLLRASKALHINGDQHLSTMTQYGVSKQRDSNWSFCTPAIAAGYPRWWRPDEMDMPHTNRPQHGLANTGEYLDGLDNMAYVYAVGNPEVGRAKNRYEKAHQKGSGFGWVIIDTEKRTYEVHSYRFLIDPDGQQSRQ